MTLILFILALVCFIAATFNARVRINLVALGLALLTLAWVIPAISR